MLRPPVLLLPALLGVLLAAGCSATNPAPLAPVAPTPAPAIELPPASITGFEEKSAMLDNFTVYVAAIDGVPVSAGRAGWSTSLPLKAGPRRLSLGFTRGVFAATAEIVLNAASATAYQIRFATDAQFLGRNSYCEFWIVDATTGQAATERVRAELKRTASGD